MKKVLVLLLLITAFCLSVFSQDKKFTINPWGGANGLQFSAGGLHHVEGEVSYIMTRRPKEIKEQDYGLIVGFHSISAGVNFACAKGRFFAGPKAYFQATLVFLTAQAGVDYMTDFNNTGGLRFTPKAGLTLGGFVSLMYGRNYAIAGTIKETGLVSSGIINLQLQLPMW